MTTVEELCALQEDKPWHSVGLDPLDEVVRPDHANYELQCSNIQVQHWHQIEERDSDAEDVLEFWMCRRNTDVHAPQRIREQQAKNQLKADTSARG